LLPRLGLKKTYFASIAVVALIIFILITFSAANPMKRNEPSSDTLAPDIEVTPHYLSTPHFSSNTYITTKIFLEKANLWDIDASSSSVTEVGIAPPEGMSLFMVNGTIRNDYSTEEILRYSKEGNTHCLVGLDVYLYDNQENFVNTLNRGNPLRGSYELDLRGGEVANFNVVFATPNVTITAFEVYVTFLEPMPLF
jgi:hypothetical protein